jgi:hypothetical protein
MEPLSSFLPSAPKEPSESGEIPHAVDLEVQRALDEVLEYHRTHRPKNTTKNYEPKQREWKVSTTLFAKGGKYFPGDYVDEGKLLLFIKEEVASRPPRRGPRLKAERQRKRQAAVALEPKLSKRRRGGLSARPPFPTSEAATTADNSALEEGEDDEACSDLVLMYNTVRGYCTAIKSFGHIKHR